jgi:hypothetical protein
MSETGMPEKRANRTWVIIVIVVGAFLLLLCACAAVVGLGLFAFRSNAVRQGVPIVFPNASLVEATRQVRQNYPVHAPVKVEVDNEVGTVNIASTDGNEVIVEAEIRAWGATQGIAQQLVDAVTVDITQQDVTHVRVVGDIPSGVRQKSPSVDITIQVPQECYLQIADNVGSVTIGDIKGGLNVKVNVGTIKVHSLSMTADSTLTTDVGEVQVSLPKGSAFIVDAQTNVGQIKSDFQGLNERRQLPGDQLTGQVGQSPTLRLTLRANTGAITLNEGR